MRLGLARYRSFVERRTLVAAAFGAVLGVGLTAAALVVISSDSPRQEQFEAATVSRVIDGDTVELESGERIRYLGIDTPETLGEPECGSAEATELNERLVQGRRVTLLKGPEESDRFGRLLRYVFVEGVFVNAELVWQGLARPQSFLPDEQFRQVLVQLGVGAQQAGRGSWSACDW